VVCVAPGPECDELLPPHRGSVIQSQFEGGHVGLGRAGSMTSMNDGRVPVKPVGELMRQIVLLQARRAAIR